MNQRNHERKSTPYPQSGHQIQPAPAFLAGNGTPETPCSHIRATEVHQEDPVFGSMLFAHLINVGIAQQTDGSIHLTQRGKDLLFILACYLDATITESAIN